MTNKMNRVWRLTLPLALALLLLAGCRSEEDETCQKAYKANYEAGYQAGFPGGEERGRKEGEAEGAAAALKAAETGEAWELYRVLASGALASGLLLGLAVQYGILLLCRRTGRLPQFSTVAFVPAMKSTVVYAVFERRRDLMVEVEEQLREMAARKNLQLAKIERLKEAMALKIKALSSIDEFSQARLLELAAEEMEKIISESERKAGAAPDGRNPGRPATRITSVCPSCQRLVRFNLRPANEFVTCPHRGCGRPFRLPPASFGGDGEPLILDADD